jgi:lysophospholipase L1-like esterase
MKYHYLPSKQRRMPITHEEPRPLPLSQETQHRNFSACWQQVFTRSGHVLPALLFVAALCAGLPFLAKDALAVTAPQWITVWAASPQSALPGGGVPQINGQTIRQRMRVSLGGAQLRVRISNEFGSKPLVIGTASVGVPTDPGTVVAGTLKRLSFGARASVAAPPGAAVVSDPVDLPIKAGSEVAVSLYLPEKIEGLTLHMVGLKTAVITPPGDFTGQTHVETAATTTASVFVSALMVPKPKGAGLVVALGDSITDGTTTTVDGDHSWPAALARRLAAKGANIAIVNHGISGNQLRRDGAGVSAQARFDRDVLAMPGVTHLIVLIGINDIGWPGAQMGGRLLADPSLMPAADDLICGYQQLIARAHIHGIKILGATLTPFAGTAVPGYYSESKEALRVAVNQWIRTSRAFDAVIDFDAALRDPAKPEQLLRCCVSQDNIHPNDAGHQIMADAIDLRLLK